jgi:hypothetical protein
MAKSAVAGAAAAALAVTQNSDADKPVADDGASAKPQEKPVIAETKYLIELDDNDYNLSADEFDD